MMYMNSQTLRKKDTATQHNTRPETTLSKEKAALRWDEPKISHILGVMLYH